MRHEELGNFLSLTVNFFEEDHNRGSHITGLHNNWGEMCYFPTRQGASGQRFGYAFPSRALPIHAGSCGTDG